MESLRALLPMSREIELTKDAGTRVGLGLHSRAKRVTVVSVSESSALAGLVSPGDVILDCATDLDAPKPATDATHVSAQLFAAQRFRLCVETPATLNRPLQCSTCFLPAKGSCLGVRLDACPQTGLPRVCHIDTSSPAAVPVGDIESGDVNRLDVGDVIVSIESEGVAQAVTSVKEAMAAFRAAVGKVTFSTMRSSALQPDAYTKAPQSPTESAHSSSNNSESEESVRQPATTSLWRMYIEKHRRRASRW